MTEIHLELEESNQEYNLQSEEAIVVGGTTDYEKLRNKPMIETIELIGNKTFADLGLRPLTNMEIEALLN